MFYKAVSRREIVYEPYSINKLPNTTRSSKNYIATLFPDDLTGNKTINSLLKFSRNHIFGNKLEYFGLKGDGEWETRLVTWDDVNKNLGGQRCFFQEGARILDLGSGSGKAISEWTKRYLSSDVRVVGLDFVYRREAPMTPHEGRYIAGVWQRLPFADNSFSGILSLESFPRYAELDLNSENNQMIFSEITRVSKKGAIWRATMLPDDWVRIAPDVMLVQQVAIKNNLLKNGWEVYMHPRLMAARLKDKKIPTSNPS